MHAMRMAFDVMLCIIVNVIDVYWLALSCTRAPHVRSEKLAAKVQFLFEMSKFL
jgi:hypothetical protein